MPLSPGTRLGPYEIVAPIGSGGMGEVYEARDTRLNRTIAVKVSAEKFSERFERESRAVAALNHPNICTLHDVGPNYLVMEYIEGQPLKGPLPLGQALTYAGQICDALDTAHRKGVIHRDLKPANILVGKSGIKLLDFGLAKWSHEVAAGAETATIALTKEHGLIGTLQYMSPEQLEGRDADHRSDIFSFGLMLYEMLTGKHPFEGASQATIIAGILERQTPSLGDSLPAALDRVMARCLAKNPDDRWQSARDLRAALQWIGEFATIAPLPEPAAAAPSRVPMWAGWVAAGVVLAASLALMPWSRPTANEVVRFPVYPPEGTVFSKPVNSTIAVPQFALAPNGRMLVFAANSGNKSSLWVRSLDQPQPRQLPGTEGAMRPFWSPDSQWIGFFGEGRMKKVLARGGAVQAVNESIIEARGASWGDGDVILYSDGSGSLQSIGAGGGQSKIITTLDTSHAELTHRWPQLLPEAASYLFTVRASAGSRGIYAGSMDGKTKKQLLHVDSSAVYAPPGYLLWVQGDTLLAQTFDAGKLELSGQPFTVAEGVGRSTTSEAGVSASAHGNLAYAGPMLQEGRLTWFERTGVGSDSPVPDGDYVDFRLSPDGNRLVTSLIDPKGGSADILMTDLQRRSRPERFTTTPGVNADAIWSPDGTKVIFRTNRSGLSELYQKSTTGGNDEVRLSAQDLRAAGIDTVSVVPTDWSADGKFIMATSSGRGTGHDLWLIPLSGEAKPSKLPSPASASDEIHANFSPNGAVVAYSSNETGRFEVYVRTISGPERRWLVSTGGGYEPRWRADGREIYYLSEDRRLMAATVSDGPSFGVPKALFQTRVPAGVDPFRMHYVPTRDGQRFLVNTQIGEMSANPITVVLNWTAGLQAAR